MERLLRDRFCAGAAPGGKKRAATGPFPHDFGDPLRTLTAAPASLHASRAGETITLTLSGHLDMHTAAAVWAQAKRALGARLPPHLVIAAKDLAYCDSAGIALLFDLQCRASRSGTRVEIRDFPEHFQPLLDMFRPDDFLCAFEPGPTPKSIPEVVGEYTVAILRDLTALVTYVGELTLALLAAAVSPRHVRWKDAFRTAQQAGVNALPVVMLIGGLIGLVLGFQSAITLRRFGADTFLANFVGLSVVRELGPLMTAVVLAARSGSSFAAELGTMKVNEEIDALSTMGLDPVRFLLTPRVIAAVIMTPLLTVFSNLAGLAGGAVVSVFTLDLPLPIYTNQLREILAPKDVLGGLVKAFVFGILVTSVGCIRGLQTRGGAIGVGESTTRAVVAGIVLIALADSLFSFLYYSLGI